MAEAFLKGDGNTVDHINGDKLDNRLSNLELVCDRANVSRRFGNDKPTSKHRGISYFPQAGKWRAQINRKKKTVWAKLFDTEEEAVRAREDEVVKWPPSNNL